MTRFTLVSRFFRNRRGIAATEFAFIFPIVVMLMFGVYELSELLQVGRRSLLVATTASDLVAQATTITNADRDDVFNASAAIMTPFNPSTLSIVVTSITNNAGTIAVAWSDGYHAVPRTSVPSNLPTAIVPPGTSIIMAETTYVYTSAAGQFFTHGITLTDSFFARPRRSVAVARTP